MSTQPNLPSWIQDHVELYKKDPDKGHHWDASLAGGKGMLTTLLLTSTGRKSGEPRVLPLIYKKIGDAYVIIASKGGYPSHPAWYLNLEANPDCHIQVAHDHFDARMRVAEGAERDDIWAQMVELYAPYADYQVSAGDRVIPVVVLEPKS